MILESPFILGGRDFLVRVLTPLTTVTPTSAEATRARYFSLTSLLPTATTPFATGAGGG